MDGRDMQRELRIGVWSIRILPNVLEPMCFIVHREVEF